MPDFGALYSEVYDKGNLSGVEKPLPTNPLTDVVPGVRPNSIAIAGGAFGDEGKGRIVDELCALLSQRSDFSVVYRWNGGANAGHTVIIDQQRVALHQLPSGAVNPKAVSILGKGMVIHPGDLLAEIKTITPFVTKSLPPNLLSMYVDEMAVLALDTHRAFESVLRDWEIGGKGATGRGISPAYADVLFRHPVRAGDLMADDWQTRLGKHYDLYAALIAGLGAHLPLISVPRFNANPTVVGEKAEFLEHLAMPRQALKWCVTNAHKFVEEQWARNVPFIFEGAQAIGLDPRFGVYPDITASDPTFSGILHSTEGMIHPEKIAVRAGAIKATYTSSVGTRRLPTMMGESLAHRIREDAHEYGATTRRPRDIAHIDIPCLRFFAEVSGMTHLVMTHLDITYSEVPIKVCVRYKNASGQEVPYRPDQTYLNTVTPEYIELPAWDGAKVRGVRTIEGLPRATLQYIAFITQALGVTLIMATTGPEREALISWIP